MATKANIQSTISRANSTLTTELQKQIQEVGAVDTGNMKKVSYVEVIWREGSDDFTLRLDVPDYYPFVDDGTKYIKSRDITKKFVDRATVVDQMEEISAAIVDYTIQSMWQT